MEASGSRVEMNFDGALSPDGAGMVLQNDRGATMFSSCRQLFSCRDALESELCTCMGGLSLSL